jgi:hypothetical protein
MASGVLRVSWRYFLARTGHHGLEPARQALNLRRYLRTMPSRGRLQLIFVAVGVLFFLPGLGAVHLFDWDEINFAEIAREMVVTGNWGQPQIDFEPFHEKPPLFMWLQALSMNVRRGRVRGALPNASVGILTLWCSTASAISCVARCSVCCGRWPIRLHPTAPLLPQRHHRPVVQPLHLPWPACAGHLGAVRPQATIALNARRDKHAGWPGFSWAGGITKGPVGVLIPGWCSRPTGPWVASASGCAWRRIAIIAFATLLTAGSWALGGPGAQRTDFMVAFFWRQVAMLTTEDAGHGGFFGYHFVVLLIGCFPASVFALQELLRPRVKT